MANSTDTTATTRIATVTTLIHVGPGKSEKNQLYMSFTYHFGH